MNWKLFLKIWAAGIITTLMVLPYTLALSPGLVELFTPVVYAAQIIQSAILFAIAAYLGIKLARYTGMEMPVWEGKKPISYVKNYWKISVGLGIMAGILIILLSFGFGALSVDFLRVEMGVATWKAILAAFYGGIGEEILFRLLVMNLILWIVMKIFRRPKGNPGGGGVWAANIVAAVLFGLGHLGITGSLTAITAIVIIRAILLNGVAAVIFGWLYWKKGLEAAMVAHFSADIVLHVITPLVGILLLG
jgi:membrane protease YdiL (CAAX protease family)